MIYRRDIDGLRAIAVLPVILFHAGLPVFSGGFVGVDVFFVISGYLIGTILLAEHDAGTLSIWRFYERRARRILPALALVCVISFAAAWAVLAPRAMKDFAQSLAAVGLFASNFHFWIESGYFSLAAEMKPLLHTWSLAVEEQFYIVLPLLLLLLGRWPRMLLLALIVVSICSFAAGYFALLNDKQAAFYLPQYRAWELFAGVFGAYYVRAKGKPNQDGLAGLGLAMIIAALLVYDRDTVFPGPAALLPVVGTLLILVYCRTDGFVGRFLSLRPLVAVGLVSYSAYLWHQPLFAFARVMTIGMPSPLVMAGLALLSIILAGLSWRYVEQPARHTVMSQRRVLVASLVLLSGFVAVGVVGHVSGGFARVRLSAAQQAILSTATADAHVRRNCHSLDGVDISFDDACALSAGRIDVATIGDSHSVELSVALAEELAADGRGLKHLSMAGCVPALGVPDGDLSACANWTKAMLERVVQDTSLKSVVIAYRLNAHLFGGHEAHYPALSDERGPVRRLALWQALLRQIDILLAADKRVILVLQAPELPQSVDQMIYNSKDFRQRLQGVPRSWWQARSAFVQDRLSDLPSSVEIIDPATIFCSASHCFASADGNALYFDDDHISVAGGRLLAKEIMQRLK